MPIAIIEDDPVQRRVLRAILEHAGREVVEFADGISAWEYIHHNPLIQLVVTDWIMPGIDGPDLVRAIRSAELPYYVYILILTARNDRADVVAGLHGGADDYLTKPIDPREFVARIAVGERILRLEQQLRATRDEQHYLANHDLLTGAFNRRAFYERLEDLSDVEGLGPVSVLMLDIDYFKAINDRFGHHTGDQALQKVVQAVRTCVRASDWVARWGGEEFVVLLPVTNHQQALRIAERIRLTIARTPLVISEAVAVSLQVSIGATTAAQVPRGQLDALLREADDALYNAKAAGRNQVWSALEGPVHVAEQEALIIEPAPAASNLLLSPLDQLPPPALPAAPSNKEKLDIHEIIRTTTLTPADDTTASAPAGGKETLALLNHELRSRFSGLIGMSELLLDMDLSDDQRDCAAAILSGSIDLLGMLDQFFNQVRAAAEQQHDEAAVDLYRLIARELAGDDGAHGS